MNLFMNVMDMKRASPSKSSAPPAGLGMETGSYGDLLSLVFEDDEDGFPMPLKESWPELIDNINPCPLHPDDMCEVESFTDPRTGTKHYKIKQDIHGNATHMPLWN